MKTGKKARQHTHVHLIIIILQLRGGVPSPPTGWRDLAVPLRITKRAHQPKKEALHPSRQRHIRWKDQGAQKEERVVGREGEEEREDVGEEEGEGVGEEEGGEGEGEGVEEGEEQEQARSRRPRKREEHYR